MEQQGREMAMPLLESPEQQEILDMKEQLEKTKSQLQIAENKLNANDSEVDRLKSIIDFFITKDKQPKETSRQDQDTSEKDHLGQKYIKVLEEKLEKVTQEIEILISENSKEELLEEIERMKIENQELKVKLDESTAKFEKCSLENVDLKQKLEARQNKNELEQQQKYVKNLLDVMNHSAQVSLKNLQMQIEDNEKLTKNLEDKGKEVVKQMSDGMTQFKTHIDNLNLKGILNLKECKKKVDAMTKLNASISENNQNLKKEKDRLICFQSTLKELNNLKSEIDDVQKTMENNEMIDLETINEINQKYKDLLFEKEDLEKKLDSPKQEVCAPQ